MSKVEVCLNDGTNYTVTIGSGLLTQCGEIIKGIHSTCKIAIITDSNVAAHYLNIVGKSLMDEGFEVITLVFDAGESSKNIETLSCILEFLADNEITRSDLIVALGGGVVGDIAGFAAATYMRGISYIQIPTTCLAMVDSSIGGKTGINLDSGKNLCGAFWQPSAVICSVDTLDTLEKKYYEDGIAEIIKYGLIGNERILKLLNSGDSNIEEIIEESINTKLTFVKDDVYDTDKRQFLNFGHTIGHAIEHASKYAFTHGHAVAIGMCAMARASEAKGIAEIGTAEKIEKIVYSAGLPTTTYISKEDLYTSALSDKKRRGDSITIVMPTKLSKCELKTVSIKELQDIISLGVK